MSRISVILSSPRHLLGALLVALLAVGAVVGSGASFTSKSANPSNTFTVTFPDGGTPASATTGDNAYKGSTLSVGYQWDAAS